MRSGRMPDVRGPHLFRVFALVLALLPAASTGAATDTPPAPAPAETAPAVASPTPAPNDPRPLVRLLVRNDFRPEDKLFPQLVEGRLVSDLADMETFRTTGHDAPGADYALTVVIRNVVYDASTVYQTSRDADAPSTPQPKDQVSLTMDVSITLEDRQ